MVSVYQGQELNEKHLTGYFFRSDGVPINPFEVSAQILDVEDPNSPQVVLGSATLVNFGIGAYYIDWTVPENQKTVTHRACWTWRLFDGSDEESECYDFEVISASFFSPEIFYLTPADFYNEGWDPEFFKPEMINKRLKLVQQYIEKVTGFIFRRYNYQFFLDGNGTRLCRVPQPIISVSDIAFAQGFNSYRSENLKDFIVYNRYQPDDRWNPKIEVSEFTVDDIFSFGGSLGRFPKGTQNIRITGEFGFVEEGTMDTPQPIKDAMMIMTGMFLYDYANEEMQQELRTRGVVSETTDGHSYTLDRAFRGGTLTGISEVDNLLMPYVRGDSDTPVSSF